MYSISTPALGPFCPCPVVRQAVEQTTPPTPTDPVRKHEPMHLTPLLGNDLVLGEASHVAVRINRGSIVVLLPCPVTLNDISAFDGARGIVSFHSCYGDRNFNNARIHPPADLESLKDKIEGTERRTGIVFEN